MADFMFSGTFRTTPQGVVDAEIVQCVDDEKRPVVRVHRGDYIDLMRDTAITHAFGTMHLYDDLDVGRAYDPPPFWDDHHNELGYLHRSYTSGTGLVYYLDFDHELFRIDSSLPCGGFVPFYIHVYDHRPKSSPDGPGHPVLATIDGHYLRDDNWGCYTVKLTRALPIHTLAAVLSLPFTTPFATI